MTDPQTPAGSTVASYQTALVATQPATELPGYEGSEIPNSLTVEGLKETATELAFRLEEAVAANVELMRLRLDDRGWSGGTNPSEVWGPEQVAHYARLFGRACRIEPLFSRALGIRASYVWGEGFAITSAQEDSAVEQNINDVVQRFLEDNQEVFGSTGREETERRMFTAGNQFLALFTDAATGRVQARVIPTDQITDILSNPEDASEPWFYKRQYATRTVNMATGEVTTATHTVYYPDVDYSPSRRVKKIGEHPVMWNAPVAHEAVNRPDGSLFGVPDMLAAWKHNLLYSGFLLDWAQLTKQLARFSYQVKNSTAAGGIATRDRLASLDIDGNPGAGSTAVLGGGGTLEAVSKTGATVDAESGRPLAAMVAAALDIPVTMLISDPGVSGARATAETLDRPLELACTQRRMVHATSITKVITYVVRQAIKATMGPLKGTITRDRATDREVITLAKDQRLRLVCSWPPLVNNRIDHTALAVTNSYDRGLIHPLIAARVLATSLRIPDVDDAVSMLVQNGEYVDPRPAIPDSFTKPSKYFTDKAPIPPPSADPASPPDGEKP